MSTHRKVKDQLDRAIKAHQNAHRQHLEQAGLGDYVDQTVSPLGPAGDLSPSSGDSDE